MNVRTRLNCLSCLLALSLSPLITLAAPACGRPATAIADVQGTGPESPLNGRQVTVEGVITLDSRRHGGFGGFYLQQADAEADQDPATSEALFVYTRKKAGQTGDRVRVTATVKEFHGLTELVSVRALQVCGRGTLPKAAAVDLPWPHAPEQLENMRVRFPEPLTVVDSYNLGRYGELSLATADPVQPTEYLPPGHDAYQLLHQQQRQRVLLDDNHSERNPRPVPWPPSGLSESTTVRAGDQVANLEGVLDYRFDSWRIQPARAPDFNASNPRRPAPPRPSGDALRIMALNLGNYFNGDDQGQDFPTPRGANSQSGFQHQRARLVTALRAPDPDILAVAELENDGYGPDSAIAGLARALGKQWQYVRTPGQDGDDEIRTALLFRSDRVTTVGAPGRLRSGPFRSGGRPPLTQAFRELGGQATVRIVVPHLKSKSCRGAQGRNLAQSDGQGCYAGRRNDEARALADWVAALPATADFAGTVIVGDLNSYAREQPLAIFAAAGFTSAVHERHPCTPDQCRHYTFRYRGNRGSLDYALVSGSLRPRVLNAQTWLINADEPRALGYQGGVLEHGEGPWRSSDHNPVILDLQP